MRAFPIASIANLSLSLSICLSLSLSICLFIPLSLYGELSWQVVDKWGREEGGWPSPRHESWNDVVAERSLPAYCRDFECVFWIPSFLLLLLLLIIVVVVVVDYCCCCLLLLFFVVCCCCCCCLLLLFVVLVGFDVIRIGSFVDETLCVRIGCRIYIRNVGFAKRKKKRI